MKQTRHARGQKPVQLLSLGRILAYKWLREWLLSLGMRCLFHLLKVLVALKIMHVFKSDLHTNRA